MEEEEKRFIKISFLGGPKTGKTTIINTIMGEQTNDCFNNLIFSKDIIINKNNYHILTWDIERCENYRFKSRYLMKDSEIIFLIFSIIDQNSFDILKSFIDDIKKYSNNSKIIILGNKNDICKHQKINLPTANIFANSIGAKLKFVSAKNNSNEIYNFFEEFLIDYLLEKGEILYHDYLKIIEMKKNIYFNKNFIKCLNKYFNY